MQTKIIVFCCVNLKINVYTMTKKVKKKKNTKLGFKSELLKENIIIYIECINNKKINIMKSYIYGIYLSIHPFHILTQIKIDTFKRNMFYYCQWLTDSQLSLLVNLNLLVEVDFEKKVQSPRKN